MKKKSIKLAELFDVNDPIISAYFDSKEYKAYMISSGCTGTRGKIRKDLIKSFKKVLELVKTKEDEDKINILFFKEEFNKIEDANLELKKASELSRDINPVGYKMLKIGDSLDFKILKASYKKAVKKYHPDVGGSHEETLALNEAYVQFHDLLCKIEEGNYDLIEDDEEIYSYDYKIKSTRDYLFVISIMLVQCYIDDWAIDKAFSRIKEMKRNNFYDYKLTEICKHELFTVLILLWKRLIRAKMKEESKYIYDLIDTMFLSDKKRWHEYKAELRNPRTRLVLTHLERGDNALRLNLIDRNKYKNLKERLLQEKEEHDSRERKLKQFLRNYKFLKDLPSDKGANRSFVKKKLIPPTGYFNHNLLKLSKEQQAEYFKAFSNNTSLKLIEKYLFVRLRSLMASVISDYSDRLLEKCIKECEFLISAMDYGKDNWIVEVLKFFIYLEKLKDERRKERILILKTIQEKYKNSKEIEMEKNSFYAPEYCSWIVNVSYGFLEWARSSFHKLREPLEKDSVYFKERKKK